MRKLTDREKFLIEAILPLNRKGYRDYRNLINKLFVVWEEIHKESESLLLSENQEKQLDFVPPIFAIGIVLFDKIEYYVLIHEFFEEAILIELQKLNTSAESFNKVKWTLSDWLPGKSNSTVREIHLIKNKLVIAIDAKKKKIWCYEEKSGINRIIPVTNFYNEIMRVKKVKDTAITLNANRLFTNLSDFTDEEIGQGFLLYNKYLKKVEIDYSLFNKNKKKGKNFIFNTILRKRNGYIGNN